MSERPRRRWRLQLDLHADSFAALIGALNDVAIDVESERPRTIDRASGSREHGFTLMIDEDRTVDPASYRRALEAWIAAERAADRDGQ